MTAIVDRIALGPKIADYLGAIVPPVLACFNDTDSKVRYFACESMYNVVRLIFEQIDFLVADSVVVQAKVAKGEILIFFNELFDAMSKVQSFPRCSACSSLKIPEISSLPILNCR